MPELIATVILLVSILEIAIIIFRKIPALAELSIPENGKIGFFKKIKDKLKNQRFLRIFPSEMLLQKALSKIRVLTLKTENKTGCWLSKLRQRALKKKKDFSDNYWQEIKKEK